MTARVDGARLLGHRSLAYIDASLPVVWELVGDPRRHPEWWPPVVGVRGDDFTVGAEHSQDWRVLGHTRSWPRIVEAREELRELRWRCPVVGSYCHWTLTEGQGGTFVEMEMGLVPAGGNVVVRQIARRHMPRWVDQAISGLTELASRATALAPASGLAP